MPPGCLRNKTRPRYRDRRQLPTAINAMTNLVNRLRQYASCDVLLPPKSLPCIKKRWVDSRRPSKTQTPFMRIHPWNRPVFANLPIRNHQNDRSGDNCQGAQRPFLPNSMLRGGKFVRNNDTESPKLKSHWVLNGP